MEKIKVSAVSYLNTLPFLNGINNSKVVDLMNLSLDIPSDCAMKLLNEEVDLGLVPIAILPQLKDYHIVSDYCIGAEGDVDSVALFSDVPLNEIENVYLDYQSRTSVNLVQLLAEKHWKISPNWLNASEGFENEITGSTAGVIIGDRTFNLPKTFNYKYDLSKEWYDLTQLPFVFACWVSNKKLPESFIEEFNLALSFGVNNISEVIDAHNENDISKADLENYLSKNISYFIDKNKTLAISKFLKFIKERELVISNS